MFKKIKNIKTLKNPVNNNNIFKHIKYLSVELEGAFPQKTINNIENNHIEHITCCQDDSIHIPFQNCVCNTTTCDHICKNCPRGEVKCNILNINSLFCPYWQYDNLFEFNSQNCQNCKYYSHLENKCIYNQTCQKNCQICFLANWSCSSCSNTCETCKFNNSLINQEVQIGKTTSWKEFSKLTKQYYPLKINNTCGGHIHIQFNNMRIHKAIATIQFMQFFLQLTNIFSNTSIFSNFSKTDKKLYKQRWSEKCCKMLFYEDIITLQLIQIDGVDLCCRNYAINNCYNIYKRHTTEFRFFPMLSNPQSYLNMIEWFLIEINEWIDKNWEDEIFKNELIFYDKDYKFAMLVQIGKEEIEIYFYQNINSKEDVREMCPKKSQITQKLLSNKMLKEYFEKAKFQNFKFEI